MRNARKVSAVLGVKPRRRVGAVPAKDHRHAGRRWRPHAEVRRFRIQRLGANRETPARTGEGAVALLGIARSGHRRSG